jgi:hypothetical protein
MASIVKTRTGTWQVRYRTPEGASRKATFATRGEAARYSREVESTKDRGSYVDPKGGRITLADYAWSWMDTKVHRPTTVARLTSNLRAHILPGSVIVRSLPFAILR